MNNDWLQGSGVRLSTYLVSQGHLARKSFARKIFKLDSWSPGAGFFPIGTIIKLSLKRRRDSDFKNNFVNMKRER